MVQIPISSLTAARRDGKAQFTYLDPETKEVRTEEIPISFLKPTEVLWDELAAMEEAAKADNDEAKKELTVRQLVRVEIQSTAIVEDDGRPHNISADDLSKLDLMQVTQLLNGVKASFFLVTLTPKSEGDTKPICSPASAAS